MGDILCAQGDLAGAEEQYRRALKLSPGDAAATQALKEISRQRAATGR